MLRSRKQEVHPKWLLQILSSASQPQSERRLQHTSCYAGHSSSPAAAAATAAAAALSSSFFFFPLPRLTHSWNLRGSAEAARKDTWQGFAFPTKTDPQLPSMLPQLCFSTGPEIRSYRRGTSSSSSASSSTSSTSRVVFVGGPLTDQQRACYTLKWEAELVLSGVGGGAPRRSRVTGARRRCARALNKSSRLTPRLPWRPGPPRTA